MKQFIFRNLKNSYGWKSKRKIVVFSVDDYGNIFLDSKKARDSMDQAGLKTLTRFDAFDALETRQDLEMLFGVLDGVKDKNNRSAVFTPFTLPCNLNFEAMEKQGYIGFINEELPKSFEKLSQIYPEAYEGTWDLWKEGIMKGFMVPQFHGREHLNVKVLNEKLLSKDHEVLTALKSRSYASISNTGYKTINYTAAFDFDKLEENKEIAEILVDGINKFENVFDYKPSVFMPPMTSIHQMHFPRLFNEGIKYIDSNLIQRQHLGDGEYAKSINYTGKKLPTGQICLVRNVVFEPTNDDALDSVKLALDQITAAFNWSRPANISSHRVNFCGHIDPKNREIGLKALNELLKKIVQKWPDVEFMSANELADLIE